MAALTGAPWPTPPLRTARLVLRASTAADRDALIDLMSSPEVGTYIGGAQPRETLEERMPPVPGQRPGFFVVTHEGEAVGIVTVDRRDKDRLGHLDPDGGELELGYLFLPTAWGKGYATEACRAVLASVEDAFPGQPVVLTTQTANAAAMQVAEKLGFTEHEIFHDYGAEQWLGSEPLAGSPRPSRADSLQR